MAALDLASYVYVCYDGEELFHERLILSWVESGEYVVLTPDSDVFIEQVDAGNADLTGIRIGGALGTVPHGLVGHQIYSFATRPAGAILQNLRREGEVHARIERLAHSLIGLAPGAMPVPGAALPPPVVPLALPAAPIAPPMVPGALAPPPPPPPPPLPPRLARAGGTWVLDEPVGSFTVGQEVPLPAGSLVFGTCGFVTIEGKVVSITLVSSGSDLDVWAGGRLAAFLKADGRVFNLPMDAASITLADADRLMAVAPPALRPLRGPPTVGDSIGDIANRTSGGFVAAHDRWVVEARIELTSRSRYEHKVLSRALQLDFQLDGIIVKRSVAFEYFDRRRQLLLEEAHRDDPARQNFDNAHVFMGEDDEASGTHLSSALRVHVAAELSRETAIQKERRKAQEARDSRFSTLKNHNKNDKGSDKNDKGGNNKEDAKP